MGSSERARWWIASLGAHLALAATLHSLALPETRAATLHRVVAAELDFEPAPSHPEEPAPAPREEPLAPAASTPAPRVIARRVTVTRTPPAPAPTPPAQPVAAPPPPPSPTPPSPPAPPAPTIRATDLLRAASSSFAMPVGDSRAAPTDTRGTLFHGTEGTAEDRARAASQGYVREVLAASTQREAPGVRAYLWGVRRRVAEVWRPGVVRVPNLAETLMAGFLAPERAMRIFGERVMRRQRQLLEAPQQRLGGAVDAIEAIGGVAGNGPSMRQGTPTDAGEESWRRNSRTTRVEVQVDQDADGRVLDVRVVRSSSMAAFDRAALEAVREGVAAQDPIPLPGGRSSRWSFTVVATRRLFAPSIGGSFDESRGWFQVQLPGQVSIRSRVQMESSAPLDSAPHS